MFGDIKHPRTSRLADPEHGTDLGVGIVAEQYLLAALRAVRDRGRKVCPRCGGVRIMRWGSFLAPERARQRFRCRDCTRTFSDFTATPLAYTKRLSSWHRYVRLMHQTMTLVAAAQAAGIHPTTAFRWRHRALAALHRVETAPLCGIAELFTDRFVEAQPGLMLTWREPRIRGDRRFSRGASWSYPVLFAVSRHGGFDAFMIAGRGATDVIELLKRRFAPGATLLHRDPPSQPFPRQVVRAGLRYVAARVSHRTDVLLHCNAAYSYMREFSSWLHRFRGIATKYLPHYIAWHREYTGVACAAWIDRCIVAVCGWSPESLAATG